MAAHPRARLYVVQQQQQQQHFGARDGEEHKAPGIKSDLHAAYAGVTVSRKQPIFKGPHQGRRATTRTYQHITLTSNNEAHVSGRRCPHQLIAEAQSHPRCRL